MIVTLKTLNLLILIMIKKFKQVLHLYNLLSSFYHWILLIKSKTLMILLIVFKITILLLLKRKTLFKIRLSKIYKTFNNLLRIKISH